MSDPTPYAIEARLKFLAELLNARTQAEIDAVEWAYDAAGVSRDDLMREAVPVHRKRVAG